MTTRNRLRSSVLIAVFGAPPVSRRRATIQDGQKGVRRVTFIALALLGASCRSRGVERGSAEADGGVALGRSFVQSDGANALAAASAADARAVRASSMAVDGLAATDPRNLPPHANAVRLCDALHGLVARRKAECCGGEASSFLATECARFLGATLHAESADLDEARVDRCVAAMEASTRGCDAITPTAPPLPAACQDLLRGKLASGKLCRSSLECEGNLHCEGVGPTRTGVCAPPFAVGAGCGTHVDVLATYLGERNLATAHPFCAEFCSLAAHKCEAWPRAGAPCMASVNCAEGQLCIAGKCSATPALSEGERCGAIPCAAGLRCVDRVCAPRARPGEACASDDDCEKGGCVSDGERRQTCGMKCNATPDWRRRPDGGVVMRLPLARKPDAGAR